MMDRTVSELESPILARIVTINRAIAWIEGHNAYDVMVVLYDASIHQHLKDDPTLLVAKLRECLDTGHTFGAWKGAQQICQAAGLEY